MSAKMMLILCIMEIWNSNVLAGKVYIEDINILYVNETYIDKDTFHVSINYKPNSENTINANIDAIKEADKEIIVKLSIAQITMGYEVPTGVGFSTKLCKDKIGKGLFDQILKPFEIEDCPPKKGSYTIEEFSPDFSKTSSFFRTGAHLSLDIQVLAEDEKIVQIKAFITS